MIADKFILFGEDPSDIPELLRIEDILGNMLCYKKLPMSKGDKKSLKNYRHQIQKKICDNCKRHPENRKGFPMEKQGLVVDVGATKERLLNRGLNKLFIPALLETTEVTYPRCNGCRVLALKQSLNRFIKNNYISFKEMKYVLVD